MNEIADLRAERDKAREECGHEKAMRAYLHDEMGRWITMHRGQKARAEAAEAKVARVDDEIRQACAAAIVNPVGWGGPMVVSFAHTILRILNENSAALKEGP